MLTRRCALLGTAAVASLAAPVAMAEHLNQAAVLDAGLLEQVRLFRREYQTQKKAWEFVCQARARADALPDCPELGCRGDVWRAWADKHGLNLLYDKHNDHSDRCVDAGNAVFATPAMTLPGVLEKFRLIVLLSDNDDLESWNNLDDPWLEQAIRDLERLSGRAQS